MDLAKVVSTRRRPTSGTRAPTGRSSRRPMRRAGQRAARRRLRLRHQAQHPAPAGRARLPHHRRAGADAGRRGAGAAARRRVPLQRPRRPGAVRLRDRGDPRRSSTTNVPIFGICLGHQLLGLALGATTVKMKFGHHGANHPVQDLDTGRVMITRQNHGFAVDEATLPANVQRRRTARCSTARCRASPAPTRRRSASRATRKRARARTTSRRCSTAVRRVDAASRRAGPPCASRV